MKDEALRLALEALGHFEKAGLATLKTIDAITAIKQALEQEKALQALHNENKRLGLYKDAYGQQEPEPVAYQDIAEKCRLETVPTKGTLLHTSPPASKPWVGLTDVEWMNIVNKDHAWFGQRPEDVAHEVAKLVEAKLREKNA